MATLRMDGLTTRYGKVTALEDLSLDIGDGEFFVVLGPSGAGKTTTLKTVAGLVDNAQGEVVIGGRSMQGVEPYHRNVAMAFESYALYPQKTVSQNLASPLRSGRTGTYSEQQQKDRIEQVTTTLGINHLLERFPRELSNGQRQRVALGRVLVRPADVYLLDEPLSHLDAKLRAAMRAELKQLGEMSNTTTLYVTHDYQEALALGDRIAVLREGRLVQHGTPQEVWEQPCNTFVARALGQPEMNLLPAAVDGGSVRTASGSLDLSLPPGLGVATGDPVLVGVRPRDLSLVAGSSGTAEPARDGGLTVTGTVALAERLGRSVELSVDVSGDTLIVVSSDQRPAEGDTVTVAASGDNVHLFAAGAGDADSPRLGSFGRQAERAAR
jgi:multiple sugar transport system ATP-binding protein